MKQARSYVHNNKTWQMDTRGSQFSGKLDTFKANLGHMNYVSKQTNKMITGPMVLRGLPFDPYSMLLFHFKSPRLIKSRILMKCCKSSNCENREYGRR